MSWFFGISILQSVSWLAYGFIYAWPALAILITAYWIKASLNRKRMDLWWIEHYQRMAGILWFTLFFIWLRLTRPEDIISLISAQFPVNNRDILSVSAGILLLGTALYRFAGTSSGLPRVQYSMLTTQRLVSFGVVWFVYLALYEFYFRGVLLFLSFPDAPIAGIVAFNVILYAGIHIIKNVQQVILSIPFGLLLVGMTYYTGHFWFALIIHLVLALGFEVSALIKQRTKLVEQ